MSKTRFHLSMLGGRTHKQIRCGSGASYTKVCTTGLQDASLIIYDKLVAIWRQGPINDSFLTDIDGLLPNNLAEVIRSRLIGVPELSDPGLDADELRKRWVTITAIRARNVSRVYRDAIGYAQTAAQEAAANLHRSLEKAFATGPHKIRETVDQARQALQAVAFPNPDQEPFARLHRLINAQDQIKARRTSLPKSAFDFVCAQLINQGRAGYLQAITQLSMEMAAEVLRPVRDKLHSDLDELASKGAEFQKNLAALRERLEAKQKLAADQQHVSHASVVLHLEGPDAKQVLAGMIARNNCADLNEWASKFLELYEERLRERARTEYPWIDANNASLSDLVRIVEPQDLADEFGWLMQESVGTGHTLYELIDKYGVVRAAEYLYQRAQHTCQLGNRDIEALNVCPSEITLVRLPQPVGPKDQEIRNRLARVFQKLGNCSVAEGAREQRDVTVVRLLMGWPIVIEQSNEPLHASYKRSAKRSHSPHLLGVIPDSSHGQPSNRHLALPDGEPHVDQENSHG